MKIEPQPSNTILIQGPLHGKIAVSDSSWAIVRSPLRPPYASESLEPVEFSIPSVGSGTSVGTCYLLLSLFKAYSQQDIWATVLSRDYSATLLEKKTIEKGFLDVSNDNEEHYQ